MTHASPNERQLEPDCRLCAPNELPKKQAPILLIVWLLTAHIFIVCGLLAPQVFLARLSSAHVTLATLVASWLFIVLVVLFLFFAAFFGSAMFLSFYSA